MFKRYGIIGSVRLLLSLIYTKLTFPHVRIIRLPVDFRNKRNIKIGHKFTTGFGCRIDAMPLKNSTKKICIDIGKNVQINDYVHIGAVESIIIGDGVLIASKVFITDHNHGRYESPYPDSPLTEPAHRKIEVKPVVIDNNVWIGESCCILPGVHIGEGCIIGALSVVTKSIPPYCIAVGSPARVVKKYNFNTQCWEKQ